MKKVLLFIFFVILGLFSEVAHSFTVKKIINETGCPVTLFFRYETEFTMIELRNKQRKVDLLFPTYESEEPFEQIWDWGTGGTLSTYLMVHIHTEKIFFNAKNIIVYAVEGKPKNKIAGTYVQYAKSFNEDPTTISVLSYTLGIPLKSLDLKPLETSKDINLTLKIIPTPPYLRLVGY